MRFARLERERMVHLTSTCSSPPSVALRPRRCGALTDERCVGAGTKAAECGRETHIQNAVSR
jgi:hypothetical protein